ncbi:hemerythrin family protein [Phormidium sp. FACHB-1136]|uniref:bacteriohemerythrin n=1 Tax=Phormidium sp. FACHB-1136 TaxID=2692848 RepID=UPI001683DF68|nr:hemerythrin family protein [Phormidium sp. FACHB-1136]MBD2426123.1 hemerythrin family protein [Phormidium sp. FACHB-1136]
MSLAYWRDACKVNHPQIDDEHHYLLTLLEKLYQAILRDHDEDAIQTSLDAVFSAMIDHCETEEALMEVFAYPDRISHIEQHEEILVLIFNYRLTLEQGLRPLTLDDVHDLATWLTSHVWTHDLKMVQFVQQQQKHYGAAMTQEINHRIFAPMA